MSSTLEKLEKNFVSIELTVSPEVVDNALEKAYLRVVKKVSLPGFRKGRVPRKMLEAHYGPGVLYEEAVEIVVPEAYEEALQEHQIKPIDQPKFDVVKPFSQGETFVFKVTVETIPEVELGDYKGLDVPKQDATITDEQVQERLQALRERHSELVTVERTVLEQGDFAVIDYEGFIEDQPFSGGAAQGQTLEIGSGTFIPGFEDALIGMEVGVEREISLEFPEDYHNAELAGKPTTFKVTIKEIKVKELPELDDEFAKALGNESMEQFKDSLRSNMEETAKRQNEQAWKDAVVAKAAENATVELPQTMINHEVEHMIHEFEHNLAYQGLNLETYLMYTQKDMDQIKEEFVPSAEKRVKTELVLNAIAKAEDIEPTEEEVDVEIEKLLQSYPPKDQARAKKELEKPVRRGGIKDAIRMERTVQFLTDNTKSES